MNQTQAFIRDTLAEAEDFMRAANIAESTLGQDAVHDYTVIKRLREGRVTLRIVERLRDYMIANWPPEKVAPQ